MTADHSPPHPTNPAHLAGRWYPADRAAIHRLLASPISRPGNGDGHGSGRRSHDFAAVLPHAGLAYSARGHRAFLSSTDWSSIRVALVLSPSHRLPVADDVTVGGAFGDHETPLGPIRGLATSVGDRRDDALVSAEHGVEMLLPVLRLALAPSARLGAVVVGPLTSAGRARSAAGRVVERLLAAIPDLAPARELAVVASSDFTHYGPRFGHTPFGPLSDRVVRQVRDEDLRVADLAARGSLRELVAWLGSRRTTVCGRYAIVLLRAIAAVLGVSVDGEVIDYYSSVDVEPGPAVPSSMVAYATIRYPMAARG